MPGIQAPGVGSGLDINGIVSQLMALERRPIDQLDSKQADLRAQISAYGQIKSSIGEFQSAMSDLSSIEKFKVFSSTSTNEDVLSVSASSSAAIGTFDIDVLRTAEHHKLASSAFADIDATTFSGNLSIQLGDESFDYAAGGQTLDEIREGINAAIDNPGITASIINEDEGYRLMLSANESGSGNFIQVNSDPFSLTSLNQDRNEDSTFSADDLDAVLMLEDTFTVTRSSNAINDVISGVDLNLQGTGKVTVDIARDTEAITDSAQAFADAFNNLRDSIDAQRAGDLQAEGTLLSMESQIFSVLNSGAAIANSSFSFLSEVGLSVNKEGRMSLDSILFESSLDREFDSVVNLFGSEDQGFASRLDGIAESLLADDGIIDAREDGLNARVDRIDDQRISLENRLAIVEERIRAQFTAMDTLVSQLNSSGGFLLQQLSLLNR